MKKLGRASKAKGIDSLCKDERYLTEQLQKTGNSSVGAEQSWNTKTANEVPQQKGLDEPLLGRC